MKYVVGFLFNVSTGLVLLVEKKKPEWQRGLLNGIGGKIENNETPLGAMDREFKEETGIKIDLEWRHFATEIASPGIYVYFFTAKTDDTSYFPRINDVKEWVNWYPIHSHRMIGNLNWLIPLALDWRNIKPVMIEPQSDIEDKPTW